MERVRELDDQVRVVLVAGLVQAGALGPESLLVNLGQRGGRGELSVVALRLSGNKFMGQGATDTGTRLFNTTRLP